MQLLCREQFNHSTTENKRQTISITLYFIDTKIEDWKLNDGWSSLKRKNKMTNIRPFVIRSDLWCKAVVWGQHKVKGGGVVNNTAIQD